MTVPPSGPDAAAAAARPDIGSPEWRAAMRELVTRLCDGHRPVPIHMASATVLALLDRIDALEFEEATLRRERDEARAHNALLRAVANAVDIECGDERYPLLHALGEARNGGAL